MKKVGEWQQKETEKRGRRERSRNRRGKKKKKRNEEQRKEVQEGDTGTKAPRFLSVTSPTREEVRGMVAGSEAL